MIENFGIITTIETYGFSDANAIPKQKQKVQLLGFHPLELFHFIGTNEILLAPIEASNSIIWIFRSTRMPK